MPDKYKNVKTELLLTWHVRISRASLAHYFQAGFCKVIHFFLSLFNVLAAISVLYIANAENYANSQSAISFAGFIVVLTTVTQFILKYDDKAYDHKIAGNEFTQLKRKIESRVVNGRIEETVFDNIRRDYDNISKNHSLVSFWTWPLTKNRVDQAREENSRFYSTVLKADIE